MIELYLDGLIEIKDKNNSSICLTPLSKCCLFFCLYPIPTSNIRVVISLTDEQYGVTSNKDAFIGDVKQNDSNMSFAVLPFSQIEEVVKAVKFPALRLSSSHLIYSGFSSVVRALVMHKECPMVDKGIMSKERRLLGLHQACLKSCKERSKWTMVCEVSLPKHLTMAVSKKFDETLSSTLLDLSKSFLVDLPIHNRNKELRQGKTGRKLHSFLEGPRKTLVDVICAFYILEASRISEEVRKQVNALVEVRSWLDRMTLDDPALGSALETIVCIPISWDTTAYDQTNRNEKLEFSLIKGIEKMRVSAKNTTDLGNLVNRLADGDGLELVVEDNVEVFTDWDSLAPHLHPALGEIPDSRLERKCAQLGNMAGIVSKMVRSGETVVDFCSGAGHLGLLVAGMLPPQCRVVLLESKEESLKRAEQRLVAMRSDQPDLCDVQLYLGNLTSYREPFQVGMALHACGAVTDLVLEMCMERRANFVISPCCYGSIKPNPQVVYPRSRRFTDHTSYDDYSKLCHASDLADGRTSRLLHGRRAMNLVDSDRALLAVERCGYHVQLRKMVPHDCTPKNNILVGTQS